MDKLKKVLGAGLTAALLASLFTVGAASTVLADNTAAGGGTVLPGGTSPAFSLTFGEDNTAQPYNQFQDGSFTVTATDSLGSAATVKFAASSAPVVTTVHGVGSGTASINAGGQLVVVITGTDTTKLDAFTVSGLKIAATAAAPKGAIHLLVTSDPVLTGVHLSGSLVPASGVISGLAIAVGATTAGYTLDAGSPDFMKTGATCGSGTTGKINIAANGVSPAESITAEAGTGSGTIQYANGGTGFTGAHPLGTVVTQTTCAAAFPSVVTVGDAIQVSTVGSTATWNAGVSRQSGANVKASLGHFNGLLAKGATVTFTIATPGVTFSTNTTTLNDWSTTRGFDTTTGLLATSDVVTSNPTLSADLKSLTFTLARASIAGFNLATPPVLVADTITIDPEYDVAAGTPAGTAVNVNVSNSASVAVTGNPATVAYVGNIVVGVTNVPNVIIATTNQSAGVITLTELGAGSFTDSAPITVCLNSPTAGASWSSGTNFWAVVTKGDLKLNIAGLPVSQGLLGMASPTCLQILDYTASTVASTIEIHTGSATAPAAGGPKINVWTLAEPGPIVANVYSGGSIVASNVIIAMAVFSGSPSAVALSQPTVVPGGIGQAAGSIQVTEGAPGAFFLGMSLNLCIVDLAKNENTQVMWSNPQGANAPVVTTNNTASSLVAHYAAFNSSDGCLVIHIDSASLSTLGVITISNLKYDVLPDATLGPVFVRVVDGNFPTGNLSLNNLGSRIDQTVSNAMIANQVSMSSGTALGVTTTGTFTASTKIAKLGKYVTWKFSGGAALAGQKVAIWVQTKGANGVWGAATQLTSRFADSAGNVYFHWKSATATWISVQARYNSSVSPSRQARWMK